MLNHFQFKLYRHDFQIKFSRCRLMMSHLLKRYASRKYLERRNIENSKLSDAALLALMCLKVQYQVTTWRKFCQLVSDVMPSLPMLEYSRFMRRCKNLIPIFQSIRSGLIEMSSYGDIAIIDSFPLPLCQDHRKFRAILFQCFADIGYNATKQKYYYGFKVHVVTDTQGLILNYELTPASIHDAKAAPEVIENCPCPFIIADVGYVGKKLQHIFLQMGYQLWTPYRSNMRFAKQHNSRQLKKIRRRIESCFADLTRQDIEHTLTRSLGGLQMNIEAIMLTHNLEVMGMLQTSN